MMMGRRLGTRIGPQKILSRPTALGEALEQLRYGNNLTLAELATASRVSLRTIKAIAAGKARAGWRTLRQIDIALGCELMRLRDEIEVRRPLKGAGRIQTAPLAIAKDATRRRTTPLRRLKGAARAVRRRA